MNLSLANGGMLLPLSYANMLASEVCFDKAGYLNSW